MKASWEPPLLFMALINLAGSALAFVEVLVFPGIMLLGNAGIFFVLLDKVRKQAKRHAPDNAPPSADPQPSAIVVTSPPEARESGPEVTGPSGGRGRHRRTG